MNVLEAEKKYCLNAIERAGCKSLFNPKILERNSSSLRCFAIACHARMREECVLVVKHTLQQPMIPMWFKEIELVAATELLAL